MYVHIELPCLWQPKAGSHAGIASYILYPYQIIHAPLFSVGKNVVRFIAAIRNKYRLVSGAAPINHVCQSAALIVFPSWLDYGIHVPSAA